MAGTPSLALARNHPDYQKQWYAKNPEKAKGYIKKARAKRRAEAADYKLRHGCADCGYTRHPDALQFDHVRGEKAFDISAGMLKNPEVFWAEVAKCEVVCANCHAERTAERRQ